MKNFSKCEQCKKKRWGTKTVYQNSMLLGDSEFECSHCGHVTKRVVLMKQRAPRNRPTMLRIVPWTGF